MSLKESVLYRAIGRSMLARYSVYAANFASMMILARLFTPDTFGIVATIAVFYVFFQLMAEAGLAPAIINVTSLSRRDRNGLFALTTLVGLVLSIIFYLCTPLFVAFYGVSEVAGVTPYVAGTLLFSAASIVPNAALLRDQKFFFIAIGGFSSIVISTMLVVLLAEYIDSLHALSSKVFWASIVNFVLLYVLSARTGIGRPSWGGKLSAIKPLLSFSGYQFGFNFINYFSRNLDNILVGKYVGTQALGVYEKAYQLMRYPLMLLTFAMTPAIQPVVRRYADQPAKVEAVHRAFVFKLSLVGALAGVVLYFLAEWVVFFALGDQWERVIPIIRILSLAIPVQVVMSSIGSFFQAMNRPELLFRTGLISAFIIVIAIAIGVYARDLLFLSWALVIAFHLSFVQSYYFLYTRVFRVSPARLAWVLAPAGAVIVALASYSFGLWQVFFL